MKKYLLGIVLALTAAGAMAVDGYKGVKFGSSFEDLQSAGLCDFKKANSQPNGQNVVVYNCLDFKFSGKDTIAAASFLDGKFGKLVIMVNSPAEPVIDALAKKYGGVSSSSTMEEIQNAPITGKPVYVRFDHDTVVFKMEMAGKINIKHLIYTSPEFDKKMNETQASNISDDI
ncbi:hypothetical protein F9879_15760 [Morganella morganii]|uniref:hypothetical protein n=1 Tax=Morganella morganii TaxID=582 RepID=UPI0015F696BC|nr:hypothetical protein [Morganella morganii]MBA5838461.1 hypothetical protein [Morganella morganii]HCR3209750.1 hypothetical protein [Morganella morganii]HCR4005178.1 hypothetical protein [Morganella morganii]HEI8512215.1 hypothetical protein [Morganella morganii]HEI8515465.1 hypothetical protein [Morganella morganii]